MKFFNAVPQTPTFTLVLWGFFFFFNGTILHSAVIFRKAYVVL